MYASILAVFTVSVLIGLLYWYFEGRWVKICLRQKESGQQMVLWIKGKTWKQYCTSVGSTDPKEIFNSALALLDWTVDQIKDGRVIASLNERAKTYKEVHMPFMDAIKRTE